MKNLTIFRQTGLEGLRKLSQCLAEVDLSPGQDHMKPVHSPVLPHYLGQVPGTCSVAHLHHSWVTICCKYGAQRLLNWVRCKLDGGNLASLNDWSAQSLPPCPSPGLPQGSMTDRLPNPLLFTLFNPVMPRFAEQVEVAIEALSATVPQPFEENEFIDASRLVYDGVRDIRKAVLMIRVREASALGAAQTF